MKWAGIQRIWCNKEIINWEFLAILIQIVYKCLFDKAICVLKIIVWESYECELGTWAVQKLFTWASQQKFPHTGNNKVKS